MTTYVHDRTTVEAVRYVNLIDGPVRPVPYSSVGRKYRVSRVVIFYRYDSSGWRAASMKLHGTVLKTDGSDSKNEALERVSRHDTQPMWLDELINDLRPVGGPVLPDAVFQTPDGS